MSKKVNKAVKRKKSGSGDYTKKEILGILFLSN